jgi:hypothetical protein
MKTDCKSVPSPFDTGMIWPASFAPFLRGEKQAVVLNGEIPKVVHGTSEQATP